MSMASESFKALWRSYNLYDFGNNCSLLGECAMLGQHTHMQS